MDIFFASLDSIFPPVFALVGVLLISRTFFRQFFVRFAFCRPIVENRFGAMKLVFYLFVQNVFLRMELNLLATFTQKSSLMSESHWEVVTVPSVCSNPFE